MLSIKPRMEAQRGETFTIPVMGVELFAGLRVRDLAAAGPFYEQLFGEPAFAPNDDEIVWAVRDGGHVYILQDPDRAGAGLVTLFADDLDATVAEIAARGLEPAECETYANGVRKITFRDADGNEIGFGGAPVE